ncbi:MAG: cation acetate symporter [Piscinibacter sp.]
MPDRQAPDSGISGRRLNRRYLIGLFAFALFLAAMYLAERMGVGRRWIAATLLLGPVVVYAGIGLVCRTMKPDDYFVAGRRVPAAYNGMAIGADWMSVASFMGLTGILYMTGFGGLAYVMGWTGGFCLIAFFLAPYLRRFGQYTIPDFLGERFGSPWPRLVGVLICALICFVYVVAQVYGVGLITARLTGFAFEIGVLVGLGGILVCSFLGGMRAVTWTQVAQYVVLLVAFLLPVVWLSVKQTGVPLPQAVAGAQLHKIAERERELVADPGEQEVIEFHRAEVRRYDALLRDVERGIVAEREAAQRRRDEAIAANAPVRQIHAAERALQAVPRDAASARELWTRARDAAEERARPLAGLPPHARPFAGDPDGTPAQRSEYADSRANFIALVLCLMAGTAGMPHVLGRFYTTPTVRDARRSVSWALLLIVLFYISAPALAVLLKLEVLQSVVGLRFDRLPAWILEWSRVDSSLLSVSDVNRDGILQLGELRINADILVLAAPEIGGMPFAVSCLVAAGALAAALSTADGLLLTTSNALVHDFYFKLVDRDASPTRRVAISKVMLLVVALLAAYTATRRPAAILHLVTPVFSIAAATVFPALILGVFWKRANLWGVCTGMLAGLVVTLYYLLTRDPLLIDWTGAAAPAPLWWGIQPRSAGVFGIPVAFAAMIVVSLLTPASSRSGAWVDGIRRPEAN